ncbi:MAG TPA: DUF4349 domain-containing protein [Thermoleophilaceae bacterium]|nr:DUF4349 domain-containing protein [Thermoleophilaceae bacterium]
MSDQLAAIDDALETGSADHHDPLTRELQELALALRADAPEADPDFERGLRDRVDRGFAKLPGARRPLWRRIATPALTTGVVALPLVLIVILAAGSDTSDQGDAGGGGGGGSVIAESGGGGDDAGASASAPETPGRALAGGQAQRAADQAGGGSEAAVVLPPDGGFAPGQRNRKIERSIGLELEMPVDQMARVAEQVTTVTNRHGGFVLSSSVSTGEDSAGGDFELRIPSARLRPALRDLAALADVRTQTQSGRDVTREHVTAKDRLQAARAERRSLLRRLELATTDEEAEAIRRRLDIVAGEINGLRSQLRGLRLRTDYAVVTVSLFPKDGDEGGAVGGSFDDALGDAGDLLVAVAGLIVRALAVVLPLGLIALLGWLAGRAVRRRQRESALA